MVSTKAPKRSLIKRSVKTNETLNSTLVHIREFSDGFKYLLALFGDNDELAQEFKQGLQKVVDFDVETSGAQIQALLKMTKDKAANPNAFSYQYSLDFLQSLLTFTNEAGDFISEDDENLDLLLSGALNEFEMIKDTLLLALNDDPAIKNKKKALAKSIANSKNDPMFVVLKFIKNDPILTKLLELKKQTAPSKSTKHTPPSKKKEPIEDPRARQATAKVDKKDKMVCTKLVDQWVADYKAKQNTENIDTATLTLSNRTALHPPKEEIAPATIVNTQVAVDLDDPKYPYRPTPIYADKPTSPHEICLGERYMEMPWKQQGVKVHKIVYTDDRGIISAKWKPLASNKTVDFHTPEGVELVALLREALELDR